MFVLGPTTAAADDERDERGVREILFMLQREGIMLKRDVPDPRQEDSLFTVSRGSGGKIYEYRRVDLGVKFKNLDELSPEASVCLEEINRCFFLCLAHCLEIHPYAVSVAFRIFARKLLTQLSPEDESVEHLKSCLKRSGYHYLKLILMYHY